MVDPPTNEWMKKLHTHTHTHTHTQWILYGHEKGHLVICHNMHGP